MERSLLLPKPERLSLVAGAGRFRMVINLSLDLCSGSRLRLNFDGCLEVRCPPHVMAWMTLFWGNDRGPKSRHCKPIKPRFQVNDRLWLKEPFCKITFNQAMRTNEWEWKEKEGQRNDKGILPLYAKCVLYKTFDIQCPFGKWKSPACMPKWAARHWFKVKSVKCEQEDGVWYFVYLTERVEK